LLNASVVETNTNSILFDGNVAFYNNLDPGQTITFTDDIILNSQPQGNYQTTFYLSSSENTCDGNLTNNTVTRYSQVTNDIFGLDSYQLYPFDQEISGSLGTNSFIDNTDEFTAMSYYDILSSTDLIGIQVLLAPGTIAGGQIMVAICDTISVLSNNTFDPLIISDTYVLTQSDVNNGRANIPFSSPINLAPNGYYAAAILFSSGGTYPIQVLDSYTIEQPAYASVIYLPTDGTIYPNGNAFGIRLNFGSNIEILGCTSTNACNYDPTATINNGSCIFIGNPCNDSNASTINDIIQSNCVCLGSPIDPDCSGFNVDAAFNSPSCAYSEDGYINLYVNGTSPFNVLWNTGSNNINLTNIASGVYAVTITDAVGCTAELNFEIDSPSPLNISTNTFNVSCAEGSDGYAEVVVFGGTPPYYYSWSNGTVGASAIYNLSAGNYSCEISDINGCTYTTTFSIDDFQGTVPEIIGLNILEPFSIETYSTNQIPNASYEWSVIGGNILQGQGSNFIQVQWANSSFASINLIITTATGCQTSLTFFLDTALSLNDKDKHPIQWSTFPNPTSDMLTISITGTVKPIDYRMLDVTGRIVLQGQVAEGLNNLSVSQLSSGIYTIEIQPTVSTRHRQQIVVE
jgi:hypothetical protein